MHNKYSVMSGEVETSHALSVSYATGFLDSARNDIQEMHSIFESVLPV